MKLFRLAVVAAAVVLALAATGLGWLNRDTPTPIGQSLGSKALDIGFPIAALTLVAVAELIGRRHPRHLVGWMFLLLGLAAEVLFVDQNYGLYGTLTNPGGVPGAGTAMWVSSWSWALPVSALVVALLVFPDGRPIDRRWWAVAWAALAAGVLQGGADAYRAPFVPGLILDSPLGTPLPLDVLNVVSAAGALLWAVALIAAGASLFVRFRRASGPERQQLKWVAYGSAIASLGLIIGSAAYAVPELNAIGAVAASCAFLLIPISAGFAILRYHLYDIDVVIERTLVYGALSAAVAATYWGFVLLLHTALRPITAGSELSVAISTLATLALVQPLRSRIQQNVDRRFYRGRYDATRAFDRFSVQLRDEVDLDAVRADLIDVVRETVQPAHASLWLRVPR